MAADDQDGGQQYDHRGELADRDISTEQYQCRHREEVGQRAVKRREARGADLHLIKRLAVNVLPAADDDIALDVIEIGAGKQVSAAFERQYEGRPGDSEKGQRLPVDDQRIAAGARCGAPGGGYAVALKPGVRQFLSALSLHPRNKFHLIGNNIVNSRQAAAAAISDWASRPGEGCAPRRPAARKGT